MAGQYATACREQRVLTDGRGDLGSGRPERWAAHPTFPSLLGGQSLRQRMQRHLQPPREPKWHWTGGPSGGTPNGLFGADQTLSRSQPPKRVPFPYPDQRRRAAALNPSIGSLSRESPQSGAMPHRGVLAQHSGELPPSVDTAEASLALAVISYPLRNLRLTA